MATSVDLIRPMVRGVYDLQMLRMQTGLRLAVNFGAKLKSHEDKEIDPEEEADKILDLLRASYRTLTSGIAKRRTLPERSGFTGDPLISNYTELVLVHQFIILEREEAAQFRQLGDLLEDVPIYTTYLTHQVGIGPAMAGVLITTLDPYKARYISSFWKYAGLDVVQEECEVCLGSGTTMEDPDVPCPNCSGTGQRGMGRSRREEHLVERKYINKKGKEATRMGITYQPWLKTKLFVLAGSFMRSSSPWTDVYREYKNRLENDTRRVKISVKDWKKKNDAEEPVKHLWTPGRIDNASKRYMIKMFLADFWVKWRTLEGLPITPTYHEAILGHKHGGSASEESSNPDTLSEPAVSRNPRTSSESDGVRNPISDSESMQRRNPQ